MADIVIFYDGPIVSRDDAILTGSKFFFTGKPCKHGHIARRYVSSGCVVCSEKQRSEWWGENKDYHKKLMADWYQENREKQDAYSAKWARENKARRSKHHAKWRSKNIERVRLVKKMWENTNPEHVARHERSRRAKRKSMVKYIVTSRMRNRVYGALHRKGGSREGSSWRDLVPYSVDDLIAHLKKTIPVGYCWDDLSKGLLHLDHIIPVSAFNFTSSQDIDFQKCWALKNLRIISAVENLRKGARLAKPFQPSFSGI